MQKTYLGFGCVVLALVFFFCAKVLELHSWVARQMCGDSYMVEPNSELAAQGILTDAACGFDADVYSVILIFGLLLFGVLLLFCGSTKS